MCRKDNRPTRRTVSEGILSEGILSEGILSEGILSEGILSEGILSEGMLILKFACERTLKLSNDSGSLTRRIVIPSHVIILGLLFRRFQ
jgi:hypothetical protein